MTYVWLIIGFILLIKGADFFVEGSSSVARLLKIPSVVIGLTIVAMGTSAPEAAVSITAALSGSNDIALSNIIGSNIFNLLVVIGFTAILYMVSTDKDILKRDLPVNIAITVLLLILLIDLRLSRIEGLILIGAMVLYLVFIVKNALQNRTTTEEIVPVLTPAKSFLAIVIGLGAVIIGGRFVVNSACQIAADFGLSENLIGLTIVAIGTSLPELATSIIAAKKGESGLALGNAVGSCIFNILFILGISSVLSPLTAAPETLIDTMILLVVTVILLITSKTQLKNTRFEGALCTLCYIGYMCYAIIR